MPDSIRRQCNQLYESHDLTFHTGLWQQSPRLRSSFFVYCDLAEPPCLPMILRSPSVVMPTLTRVGVSTYFGQTWRMWG